MLRPGARYTTIYNRFNRWSRQGAECSAPSSKPRANSLTDFTAELRHRCRNPRCRSKLPAPVANAREAFCARGCHGAFYRARCLVCEGTIEQPRRGTRLICKKAKCKNAWRTGLDHAYVDGLLADPERSNIDTAASAAAVAATSAAAAPSSAASATSAAASAAAPSSAASAAVSAAAPTSAVPATAVPATAVPATAYVPVARELYAGRMCSGVFLVENIEGPQADVEDFFLAKGDYVTRCSVLLGYILCRDCGGCAARQR